MPARHIRKLSFISSHRPITTSLPGSTQSVAHNRRYNNEGVLLHKFP